ncbi:MAG: carboxypeptidase [Ardenticatenaceae bacterium]|nr:carboxypeptidase [Ardenticatenaceae bacterium]MCB9005428.1 carboxypeptidase [Ardenticatenaceae bacterium]
MRFDRYYRYDELTAYLQAWADEYAAICKLDSLGKSYEGRDIWVMTVTHFASGPADKKPAMWVDGNIHATEVSGSTAALHLLHKLLTEYGRDERVTQALDSRAFYIVPRLNPDGAEWALADIPKYIRSSTRPYPRMDSLDGLHQEDVDSDGRILQMRLRDPNGNWKIHPDDPRIMIPRAADEPPGGNFYRIIPEGRIQNYDGVTINAAPNLQGLDLNRQFPILWEPNERGAGQYPGSEPEPQAAMRWIVDHPNITGSISYHTFSGVYLRPPTKSGDDSLPTPDLRAYQRLGAKATELTGYPAVSVFHDFKYDPKEFIKGTFDDWMYDHQGIYAWTCEIWSVQRQAGIKDYKFMDWFREHPQADDEAIMRWNDEALEGKGWVDWYEFDHPQLGPVEIGGWDFFNVWRNPPRHLLEKEVSPLSEFALYQCLVSPKLEWYQVDVQSQGNLHWVRAVVHNTGWLPSNVSKRALEQKVVRELEVDIALPDGAKLVTGTPKTMLGQLAGRDQQAVAPIWGGDATTERAKVEWVIEAEAGTAVTITATHQRAGTIRKEIELG